MKVSVLCSGSNGNVIAVESCETRFLVDLGVSPGRCSHLLHEHDWRLANIRGAMISHLHMDHARFAPDYLRRGIRSGVGPAGVSVLDGMADCRAFAVPHDAPPPGAFGFHITESETNAALSIIMDSGSFNEAMKSAINASDVVVFGVDYDEELEGRGEYDHALQSRIRSKTGHMSNQDLATFVAQEWNGRAHTWVLVHLSERRNSALLACDRFREAVESRLVSPAQHLVPMPKLIVSAKNHPTEFVKVNQ